MTSPNKLNVVGIILLYFQYVLSIIFCMICYLIGLNIGIGIINLFICIKFNITKLILYIIELICSNFGDDE